MKKQWGPIRKNINEWKTHDAADAAAVADRDPLRLVGVLLPLRLQQLLIEQQLVELAVEESQVLAHVLHLRVFVVAQIAARPVRQRVHDRGQLVQVVPGHVVTITALEEKKRLGATDWQLQSGARTIKLYGYLIWPYLIYLAHLKIFLKKEVRLFKNSCSYGSIKFYSKSPWREKAWILDGFN